MQALMTEWIRPGKCQGNHNCVEVRFEISDGIGGILIRDSKNLDVAPLPFSNRAFAALLHGLS